jgi:hypothetical protein
MRHPLGHRARAVLIACGCLVALGCTDLLNPRHTFRAELFRFFAPDSVMIANPISIVVRWGHGACERRVGLRVVERADTIIVEGRLRRDVSVFNGICDADILFQYDTTLAFPGRPPGTLFLLGLDRYGRNVVDSVRIVP